MTEKQGYDWHAIGDAEEFARTVAKLGQDLLWCIAKDSKGFTFKGFTFEDRLQEKINAWSGPTRRQSKQAKDFTDIIRLVESHPHLWNSLPDVLRSQISRPTED